MALSLAPRVASRLPASRRIGGIPEFEGSSCSRCSRAREGAHSGCDARLRGAGLRAVTGPTVWSTALVGAGYTLRCYVIPLMWWREPSGSVTEDFDTVHRGLSRWFPNPSTGTDESKEM